MGKLSIETHNNIDKNSDRVYKDKMINRTIEVTHVLVDVSKSAKRIL